MRDEMVTGERERRVRAEMDGDRQQSKFNKGISRVGFMYM